jgi:xanthine dehydrogenase YagR molybdenum-binding subunit
MRAGSQTLAPFREVDSRRSRVDALEKVTGRALYTQDIVLPGMLHAVLVRSQIPRGAVLDFDLEQALKVEGVRAILLPDDLEPWASRLPRTKEIRYLADRMPLSRIIRAVGEEIAAVVADRLEQARAAAALVKVRYQQDPAILDPEQAVRANELLGGAPEVHERGDVEKARAACEVRLQREYSTDNQFHNPMETHGCVAHWVDDKITLYDSNQGVHQVPDGLSKFLDMPKTSVRVITYQAGGGPPPPPRRWPSRAPTWPAALTSFI